MRTVCRHCRERFACRPRGLCWGCFYRPGVRDLYPSTSKFARRSRPDRFGPAPLPALPTTAMPGSEEKIAALEERARLGQSLFHPDDGPEPLRRCA